MEKMKMKKMKMEMKKDNRHRKGMEAIKMTDGQTDGRIRGFDDEK